MLLFVLNPKGELFLIEGLLVRDLEGEFSTEGIMLPTSPVNRRLNT